MQVHGKPLDGFQRREVMKNPELGIRLGIQWLAYCTTRCEPGNRDPHDWHFALTQYGASPQHAGSGNKCKVLGYARKRIKLAKKSRAKIDKAMDSGRLGWQVMIQFITLSVPYH